MTLELGIEGGALRGVRVGEVVHYRNVPYAEAVRFGTPKPIAPWAGTRDASRHGPVCPQMLSPITPVIGRPSEAEQSEACLTLSVSVPATAGAARPVMVWLHGGAYLVGASSYDWYRTDALVREGDAVVVSVNYRLGVFGYLHLPDVSPPNLGLLDQLAALQWVQRNIAAFGGDPTCVTVFGESAGAHSVIALMACPEARGLFKRAIAQSPHLGVGFTSPQRARRVADTLRACLDGRDLRDASSAELLAAQKRMQVKLAGPGGFNTVPPFGPIAGLAPLTLARGTDPCSAELHDDVDLLIGNTRDEMRAYWDINPRIKRLERVPRVGPRAYAALVRALTERVFERPVRRLADLRAKLATTRVYLYRFEWQPADAPFGSCHTIDLPFTFGSDAWASAPMLGRTPWTEVDRLGRELRSAWTQFARTGDPNLGGTPPWRPHQPGAAAARRFFSD